MALVGIETEYLAPEASAPAVAGTDTKAQMSPPTARRSDLRASSHLRVSASNKPLNLGQNRTEKKQTVMLAVAETVIKPFGAGYGTSCLLS